MKRSPLSLLIAASTMTIHLFSMDSFHDREESNLFEIAMSSSEDDKEETKKPSSNRYPSQSQQGAIFASAKPHFESNWGVIVFGDWIYWKAAEEGLEYGVQTVNPGSDLQKSLRGNVSKIAPNYHSGDRIGIDLFFPHDVWDVLVQWTRYQNKKSDSIHYKSSKIIWPNYLNENGQPSALSTNAKWDMSYGVLDLELGRAFFIAKHLSLRPFISFEAAWIKQQLKVVYGGINFNGADTETYITSNNHNHFKGYGLRAGIDTKWPLECGISFFGNASLSLLSSEFETSQFEKNANSTQRTHLKDKLRVGTRMVQMTGGIQWETLVYKDRLLVNIHAGWEQQIWFDQNQLNLFLNGAGTAIGETLNQQGNLTLSGLTLGATFGF